MSETNFIHMLRDKFRGMYGIRGDWQRFEDKLSPGIPDINAIANGVEWWLEAKFLGALPKRRINLGLRTEQRIWLQRGSRVGRRTAVILHVKKFGYYFIPGSAAWCKPMDMGEFDALAFPWFKTAEELLRYIFTPRKK